MENREIVKLWLMHHLGIQYLWGGDNPIEGMDCSGFAIEFLNAFYSRINDTTAAGLYNIFVANKISVPKLGTLIFYGTKTKPTHVAIALNNYLMIEAGGGSSVVRTKDDAARMNAFIRIRPIARRSDIVAFCHPTYRWD